MLERRDKKSRMRTCFTFCLPGRPKVNAGGACGAGLAGRDLLRISASATVDTVRQAHERHRFRWAPARLLRDDILIDELVQWMVQDASLRR
jgi:hypothetical protein